VGFVSLDKVLFGQFVLDIGRYQLTRDGTPVRLERIPMDLLILLANENGRLIGREEIIQRLWGKDLHFDTDNSINTAVRKIRHALGDNSGSPEYIETIPGKGYRFKVRTSPSTDTSAAQIAAPRMMLAVLPFENLSGDSSQEYFSDGLTEETIARLGQLSPSSLGVIARTSSMAYKQTNKSVTQIARELGVDYVLEGSVRREADRVRVTAQLIRAQDQTHLWAESYDRRMPGILDIHSEAAAAIVAEIKLKLMLTGEQPDRLAAARDAEAQDHYLRGRYHYARSNLIDLQKAVGYFKRAVERDPGFALAHSGMSDSLVILPISGDLAPMDVLPDAKMAAAKALEFGPNFAESHTADCNVKFWFDWDFKGAEAAARRAIQLNENYATAHLYLAHVLSNVGRHDEALDVIEQALVLDPFSLIAGAMRGQFLYHAGRHAESVEQFHVTLGMEPRFWVGQICAAKVYEKLQMYPEALRACEHAWEYSSGNTEAPSIAGYIYAVTGDRAKADDKIREMLSLRKHRYVSPYNVALVYAGLGETESAMQWLEQAFEERDVHMTFLLDHKWDGIRSNERFQSLLLRVGFPVSAPSLAGA
jgi:TolB-like protein